MVNNDSKYESGKTNGSSDRVDNDKNQYFHWGKQRSYEHKGAIEILGDHQERKWLG
jgi:hypothetical protein